MKPNVPWWTKVCAKSSLLSVNAVRIAPRSWRRAARRGMIAAPAINQRCACFTSSRSSENGSFDVLARPELEHQQAPEAVAVIRRALVLGQELADLVPAEPLAVGGQQVMGK